MALHSFLQCKDMTASTYQRAQLISELEGIYDSIFGVGPSCMCSHCVYAMSRGKSHDNLVFPEDAYLHAQARAAEEHRDLDTRLCCETETGLLLKEARSKLRICLSCLHRSADLRLEDAQVAYDESVFRLSEIQNARKLAVQIDGLLRDATKNTPSACIFTSWTLLALHTSVLVFTIF